MYVLQKARCKNREEKLNDQEIREENWAIRINFVTLPANKATYEKESRGLIIHLTRDIWRHNVNIDKQ